MLVSGQTNADDGREQSARMARAGEPSSDSPAARHVDDVPHPAPSSPRAQPIDFAAEYQRAYRVLWVVAAGVLGRSSGAEDVLQEAALLALGKIDQFQPGTHFAAWMAQMVRYVALNQLRKQTRSQTASLDSTAEPFAGTLPHRGTSPESPMHLGARGEMPAGQSSFDDDLTRALASLSDVARGCLLLRTIEGLDYAEIGQILAIPEGTAMSHVHRSRMRLREQLLERQAARHNKGRRSS